MPLGRLFGLAMLGCLGIGPSLVAAVEGPPALNQTLETILSLDSTLASTAAQRLAESRGRLGLDADHDFQLRALQGDALGQSHARFRQLYRGVPVWGAEGIIHIAPDGGELPLTDGFQRGIRLGVKPSIGPSELLAQAQARSFPGATLLAEPRLELVIYPETLDEYPPSIQPAEPKAMDRVRRVVRYLLAYHLHVEFMENGRLRHLDQLLNAHTSGVLASWDSLQTGAATGTGKSQHSGSVVLNTATTSSGYELRDLTRGGTRGDGTQGNTITNLNHGTSGEGAIYTDADNTWGDGQNYLAGTDTTLDNGQTAAVDAAYGLQASWDYFKKIHGRTGIDGAGSATSARVHFDTNYDNAFWSSACFCLTFGDGSSFKTMTPLDIVGHEMTHGVTATTAGLIYSGESGGLNESTSDIFGTMVEFHARGGGGSTIGNSGGNWTEGEQVRTTPLRYFYKPSLDGRSPDAWSATLGSLNVHYSSGPMNRCFYFLSQGSSSDSSSQTYSSYLPGGMAGLGNDKAAAIWYRALTVYLTPSSGYKEARIAALKAAKDLYGSAGAEFAAVQNAFAAINVGGPAGSGDDLDPPTVTAAEAGSEGDITLSATVSDNVAVSRVEFLVDGVPVAQATGPSFSTTLDSTTLPNGSRTLVARAYDTVGNMGISAPVAFSLSNNVSNLLTNPGFEGGSVGWTASSDVILTGKPTLAHAGQGLAWLGGWDTPQTDFLEQPISLPAAMAGAELRFWLKISNAGYGPTPDVFKVKVLDATGKELGVLGSFSSGDAADAYVLRRFDLSSYAGKAVRIHFECVSLGSYITNFFVDDCAVRVALQDLAAPAVAATVAGSRGNLTLSATATDDVSVTKVEFYIDNGLTGTHTTEPYRAQLDSTKLADGAHTFVAKAYDASGKNGSATVPFTVDNQPPTVTVAASGSKGAITFSATAKDNLSVVKVEFNLDGNLVGTAIAEPYQVSYDSNLQRNGTHTIQAKAYDAAGNAGQSSLSFTIDNPDTTAPSVTSNTSGKRGYVYLYGSATDNVAVTKMEGYIDDKLVAVSSYGYLSTSYDSTQLKDGAHAWVVKAWDAAGNVGTASTATFSTDNTAPVVTLAPVAVTTGQIKLSATATDNVAVTRVTYYLDGGYTPLGSLTTVPYDLAVDSTKIANGSHSVRAYAQDEAGNATYSASQGFTVSNPDTTPPVVNYVYVGGQRGTISFSASATDLNGLAKMEFWVDGVLKGTVTPSYGSGYLSIDSTTLADGSHALVVKAHDPSGNVGSSTTYSFSIDNTPPAISVTAQLDDAKLKLNILATASDNLGVQYVYILLDGNYATYLSNAPFATSLDARSLANGTHTVEAIAYDTAGNSNKASVTVKVDLPDTTAPTVSAYASGKRGTISLFAYANDLNGVTKVEFHVDGVLKGSPTPSTYGYASLNLDTTSLTDGTHKLIVKAYDFSGNVGSTAPIDFNVDNTPPLVAPSVSGNSGSIAFLSNASDNLEMNDVDFYVDGAWVGSRYASPFTLSYDSTLLKNGTHSLVVNAYDSAGNRTDSAAVMFTTTNADTTAPYINAYLYGSSTLYMSAYASDVNGVAKVEFYVDGVLKGTVNQNPSNPTNFSFTLAASTLTNGSHTMVAKAYDPTGNVGTSYPTAFIVDNTDTAPPTINGVYVSGTSGLVTASAVVSDNREVAKVEFLIDGAVKGSLTQAPYAYSFDSTKFSNGNHTLVVRATDAVGNQAQSAPTSFTINNPDLTPPSVTAAVEGSWGTVRLLASASDNVGVTKVEFYVDGQLKGSATQVPFELLVNGILLGDGQHALVAKAYDAAGNAGVSTPFNFIVDNTDSTSPTVSAQEKGTTGAITLSATAQDDRSVAKVAFFIDDISRGEATTSPYTLDFDSALLRNGNHTLVAKAYDLAGNVGTSLPVAFTTFNQDSTLPEVTVSELGSTGTVTFTAHATDKNGVEKVEFYVDDQMKGAVLSAPFELQFDSGLLANGTHSLMAKAYDPSGNVGISQPLVFTTQNIQVVVAPAQAVVQKTRTASFVATVSGATDSTVSWSVLEPTGGTITSTGLYTAPPSLGTYHVVAASNENPNRKASVTIHVVNPPDMNGDGRVNGIDLGNLASTFSGKGIPASAQGADLDGDGDVDDEDLDALLAEFGK